MAWGLLGASVLFTGLMCWAVMRELKLGFGTLAATCAPAAAAAIGVIVAAGAVRLLWTDLSLPALLTATAAGALGAAVTLRATSPGTYRDVIRQARGMRRGGLTGLAPS
jgi:hypothetical protein